MKKVLYLSVIATMLYSTDTFGLETNDPLGEIDFGGDLTVPPVEAAASSNQSNADTFSSEDIVFEPIKLNGDVPSPAEATANQSAPSPANSAKSEGTDNAGTFGLEDIVFEPINPNGDATLSANVPNTQSAPAELTQIKPINSNSGATVLVDVPKSQSVPLPANSKELDTSNDARLEQLLKQLEESIKLLASIRVNNPNSSDDLNLSIDDDGLRQLSEHLMEGARFVKSVNNPNTPSSISDSNLETDKLRQLSEQLIKGVQLIEDMIGMQNADQMHM